MQFPDSAMCLTVTRDDTSFRSSSKLKFSICKRKNENIRGKYNTENQALSCHKDVVSMKSMFFFIFLLIWCLAKNCADFAKST